ncbi:hypothetical protein [Vibrio splendidus]|uniref:hypothetical protein n=1 Tax=Vibrio splendidus TaxID=29497 RepID=UPI002468256D|nr:hypothetical protein [Vibrio splendidus]MDH5896735.1 hypothetical protein [Vibrio splendidus]
MIKYILLALASFSIGAGGMYYLTSMTLEDLEYKYAKSLEKEFELFRYQNSGVAEALIKASNVSIKHTLCMLEGEDKEQVIASLILNAMFSSDISKQSLATLEEVFTTSLVAYAELSRTSNTRVDKNLLPLIRNHCTNHLPNLDCEKIDSLIEQLSEQPSSCT